VGSHLFQHPTPDRLVGDVKPSFGQQFLDVAVAQGEAEIEPDRVRDDLGREAMTAVAERSHLDNLPDRPASRPHLRNSAPVTRSSIIDLVGWRSASDTQ
jgi:hypothetical protein